MLSSVVQILFYPWNWPSSLNTFLNLDVNFHWVRTLFLNHQGPEQHLKYEHFETLNKLKVEWKLFPKYPHLTAYLLWQITILQIIATLVLEVKKNCTFNFWLFQFFISLLFIMIKYCSFNLSRFLLMKNS